jgi:hypothetical protein
MNNKDQNIEDIVQTLRQLKISQIRKQLERDAERNPDRFFAVALFINLAKEQM